MKNSMRKRRKIYNNKRQYWNKFWRYKMFSEVFFPTIMLGPDNP